jgi:hypothetical protein
MDDFKRNIPCYIRQYTYQVLFIVILIKLKPNLFPEWFIDIIRAIYVIIALLVIYFVYIYYGTERAINSVYNMYPSLHRNTNTLIIINLINILVHYLPVLILGFPKNNKSYIYAICITLIWYSINKKDLKSIYKI